MALSASRLLQMLHESQARVKELEAREPDVRVVERVVEVPVEVVREVIREVVREVEVPKPYQVTTEKVVEKIIYRDNPEHIETINKLKAKICQFTSQSDS